MLCFSGGFGWHWTALPRHCDGYAPQCFAASFDLSYVSMIFSLQASEIAAGKLHAANGPAEPGQAQGEGWVQFTAPRHTRHIHSLKLDCGLMRLISS